MTLDESAKKTFFDTGVLKLPRFVSQKVVYNAREKILAELVRLNLKVGKKLSSSKFQNLPIFQQTTHLSQMIKGGIEIERLFFNELLVKIEALVGTKLRPALLNPQVLLSFPHKQVWSLKQLNWHLDLKPPINDEIPGVQAFILIDDVQPRGGATLALAGSHRLHYIRSGYNAHEIFRTNADFISHPEKFLIPQLINDTQIQIIEMCGHGGDVYLMDLRILHSPSINSSRKMRMMTTNRFIK